MSDVNEMFSNTDGKGRKRRKSGALKGLLQRAKDRGVSNEKLVSIAKAATDQGLDHAAIKKEISVAETDEAKKNSGKILGLSPLQLGAVVLGVSVIGIIVYRKMK